jgi:hypothetical protein
MNNVVKKNLGLKGLGGKMNSGFLPYVTKKKAGVKY